MKNEKGGRGRIRQNLNRFPADFSEGLFTEV